MRALALVVALMVLLGTPLTSEVAADPPDSLEALDRRLRAATARLEALVAESRRDVRERHLETYLAYTAEQMQAKKRAVRAEHLIAWMADDELPFAFRAAVKSALHRGATILQDPDLSADIKRGAGTNRGSFSRKHVTPLLKKRSRETRALAAALLTQIWGRLTSVKDIFGYNVEDKKTWQPAYAGWRKYLKKR